MLSADALCALLPVLWRLPLHRLRSLNTDFPHGSWPYLQVGAATYGHRYRFKRCGSGKGCKRFPCAAQAAGQLALGAHAAYYEVSWWLVVVIVVVDG